MNRFIRAYGCGGWFTRVGTANGRHRRNTNYTSDNYPSDLPYYQQPLRRRFMNRERPVAGRTFGRGVDSPAMTDICVNRIDRARVGPHQSDSYIAAKYAQGRWGDRPGCSKAIDYVVVVVIWEEEERTREQSSRNPLPPPP